jgi:hypothetical protein
VTARAPGVGFRTLIAELAKRIFQCGRSGHVSICEPHCQARKQPIAFNPRRQQPSQILDRSCYHFDGPAAGRLGEGRGTQRLQVGFAREMHIQ